MGTDRATGLALLRVPAGSLPYAVLGTDRPRPVQLVVAIGNPLRRQRHALLSGRWRFCGEKRETALAGRRH
jgi:S1-C subfamily serine protease